MKPIEVFIKRPIFTSVLIILAVVIGIYSYTFLGVDLLPPVEFPVISITTSYPGASPEDIEQNITEKIEEAVSTIDGIDHVYSTSLEGLSIVTIEFNLSKSIDNAFIDVVNRINRIKSALPEDASEPTIRKFDINARPFMRIAITGNYPQEVLKEIAENDIEKYLLQIDGMASISIRGGEDKEVQVLLDPDKMVFYDLPFMQIVDSIHSNNENASAGHITSEKTTYSIRVNSKHKDYRKLQDINIPTLKGGIIPLKTIAMVKIGTKEKTSFARLNTKDSVTLSLYKRPDANIVTLADKVKIKVKSIERSLPPGLNIRIVSDRSRFIRNSINNVINTMLIAVTLTAIVLFLFLNRIYPTFIIALAMPTSIISTFLLFALAGFTLNIMSLLGLAISVGVLVNNSILVLENIYRYEELGYPLIEASKKGAGEIFLAVVSTTLTNIGVFIPTAFMGGIVGMFFKQFGLAVVFSTLMSLLVSFTLTPTMAAHPVKGSIKLPIIDLLSRAWNFLYNIVLRVYTSILKALLKHPKSSIAIFIAVFIPILWLYPLVGFQFYPRVDRGSFSISIELPPSATLNETMAIVSKVENLVKKIPEVEYISSSGGGRGSSRGTNYGEVNVELVNKKDRKRSTFQIAYSLRKYLATIPGAKFTIDIVSGHRRGKPIQLEIRGKDVDALNSIAERVKDILKSIEGTADIDSDWRTGRPQLVLRPYTDKLSYYGTNSSELASLLSYYITGKRASTYIERGNEYNIVVKINPERIKNIRDIENLPFINKNFIVPYKELAKPVYTVGPVAINRKDQLNTITVSCNVVNISVGKMYQNIRAKLQNFPLPTGYSIRFGGEVETMTREFSVLFKALILAVVLTFLMIAAILESYKYAAIIMLTLPLASVGILIALIISRITLNIYGIMGMIMLVGLVVNNAIVVLDYTFILRKEGKNPYDAILTSCKTRLRPILMANLTTIAGWLPLTLGLGEGGEYMRAMAVVVTGGLISGGWLALLVIPVIYYALERRHFETDKTYLSKNTE